MMSRGYLMVKASLQKRDINNKVSSERKKLAMPIPSEVWSAYEKNDGDVFVAPKNLSTIKQKMMDNLSYEDTGCASVLSGECLDQKSVQNLAISNKTCSKKGKKPKRPCLFCGTMQTKLFRHLIRKHPEEEAVKEAMSLPQAERYRAIHLLKKQGIYSKNIELLKDDVPLMRERNQGDSEAVMCSKCKGFYNSKQIWRHKRYCHDNNGYQSVVQPCNLKYVASALNISEEFKSTVVDRFRNDEVGRVCKTDKVVLLLGVRLWAKSRKKDKHIIMSDMRLLSQIIVHMRIELINEQINGEDVVDPEKFEILSRVIEAKSISEGKLRPGLKLKIGFLLKKVIKLMKGYYLQRNEIEKSNEVDRFAAILDLNWDYIFYSSRLICEERRTGLRKPKDLPDERDIKILRDFLIEKMTELCSDPYHHWGIGDFIFMRNLIVTRLTMFNARRGGEPARLTVQEWEDAEAGTWIDPNLVLSINDPMEHALLAKFKLAYQSGKGSNKLVPILVPEDTILPIKKLLEERKNQIPTENMFLFPNTSGSLDHVNGWHSLNAITKMLGGRLTKPKLLIADKFRHRMSTLFALLELPIQEREKFYRHMGHSENVNKNVYQCPMAIGEIVNVGKFLNSVDEGTRTNIKSMVDKTPNTPEDTECYNNTAFFEANMGESEDSNKVDIEEPKMRRYKKWSREDTCLVQCFFKEYILPYSKEKKSLPGKKEIQEFLSCHSIFERENLEEKLLIDLIKTKVFNEKKKSAGKIKIR